MSSKIAGELAATYDRKELVRWWEARRLHYNQMVGLVGVVTWVLVLVFGSLAVKPGVDFEEPMAMIIGPIFYGILANMCYSLGWIVDTVFYAGHPRVRLYKAGLGFSLILTALPGIWAVVAWGVTLHTGNKFD